jgi:hypothetical protein
MRFYYLLFIITTSNFHLDIPERGYNEPVKWRFFLNTTHIMTYKWNLNEKTKGERGSFIDKKRGGCPTVYYQIASAHSDILCVKSNQDLIFAYFCLQTNIVRIIIGEKPVWICTIFGIDFGRIPIQRVYMCAFDREPAPHPGKQISNFLFLCSIVFKKKIKLKKREKPQENSV